MVNKYLAILVGIIVLGFAIFAGSLAGKYFGKSQKAKARNELSQKITAQIWQLNLGDTLPNIKFEVIGGDFVSLYNLLSEKSVLIVITPDCQSCHDQMIGMKQAMKSPNDAKYFIYVSWGNPRYLQEVRDEFDIASPILYDHRKQYFSRYDIFTFPFNITVNKEGVVLDMLAGTMLKEEFEEIIEYNKRVNFTDIN